MAGTVRRLLPLVRKAEPEDGERAPILDAALDAFLDFGIKRTSMGEVAKRSRLSLATLYRRFTQKPELVRAVGLREVRRFLAEVDRKVGTLDPDTSGEDQIAELLVTFLRGLRSHRLLVRLLATEPEIILPHLTVDGAPVLELGRDYLVEFIERLQRENKVPAFDPAPVAEMVARTALSLALTPQTVIPLDDDDAARQFARTHIAGAFLLAPLDATRNRSTA